MASDSYLDLLQRLIADFAAHRSPAFIEESVARCRAELAGQTPRP